MSPSHLRSLGLISAVLTVLAYSPALAEDPAKPAEPAVPAAADAGKTATPTAPPPAAAVATGWSVQCANAAPAPAAADGKTAAAPAPAALNCQAEQSIVVMPQRQFLLTVVVQVAASTKAANMIIHLPLGLELPAGAKIAVDDGKADTIVLETCDPRGCYGNQPLTAETIDALGKGKALKVSFQNLNKQPIDVSVPLDGFLPAYQKL
jgi:invasion protein IalB